MSYFYIKSAWHAQHHHPFFFFSSPPWFWYQKFSHIFLTFVLKFGVNIPNTSGEINVNIAWKLENVVTTLNKAINNISTIFSYYFLTRYKVSFFFSLWMRYLDENWPCLQVLARLIFQNFMSGKDLTSSGLDSSLTVCISPYLQPMQLHITWLKVRS